MLARLWLLHRQAGYSRIFFLLSYYQAALVQFFEKFKKNTHWLRGFCDIPIVNGCGNGCSFSRNKGGGKRRPSYDNNYKSNLIWSFLIQPSYNLTDLILILYNKICSNLVILSSFKITNSFKLRLWLSIYFQNLKISIIWVRLRKI